MTDKHPWHWSARISFISALLLGFLLTVLGTALLTRWAYLGSHYLTANQRDVILAVADFPKKLRVVFEESVDFSRSFSRRLFLDRALAGRPGWANSFPAAADSGYLLFAGVDSFYNAAVIKLIRISDGRDLAVWVPDWRLIAEKSVPAMNEAGFGAKSIMATNPVFDNTGAVVFNAGWSLVKLAACSNTPAWVIGREFHHSVEVDADGDFWVPTVGGSGYSWSAALQSRFRDDAIGRVSADGKLLQVTSVAGLLIRNDLLGLLLGAQGGVENTDPVHLNQISVAKTSSAYWEKGDLLLSLRNLSTVLIYRPSSDKVVWYKTGPWVNQHNAAFLGDHQISVFNNNALVYSEAADAFLPPSGANGVSVYDFQTGEVSEPFKALLALSPVQTATQGRAQLLVDGGLFIEETQSGRHLRFTSRGLLWQRINYFDEQHLGALAWSRYLSADEAAIGLAALARAGCLKSDS